MKAPQTNRKGIIHPTPTWPSSSREAQEVLKLLPAAIMALAAALAPEDREVLAYLLSRSFLGPWPAAEEKRRCWRPGHHRPLFCCGCFDCYTSYWMRWDSSSDRELIHQVIEAFEEEIASNEQRRHGRRGKMRRRDRTKKEAKDDSRSETARSKEEMAEEEERLEEADAAAAPPEAVDRMKTRGWADVSVFFNSRFWSLWSPGI